ncbi:MAG: hypothetical protein ACC742_05075 [Thermoanaerobaculales bacterium]
MRREFYCPHCRKLLNPGSQVVFIVEHHRRRELVLLAPEFGDYSIIYPASFDFDLGTLYTFRCPLCRADLSSNLDQRLVDILTLSEDGTPVRVSFSRVYGERATFVFAADHVDRYGEHAERYASLNFFGEALPGDDD